MPGTVLISPVKLLEPDKIYTNIWIIFFILYYYFSYLFWFFNGQTGNLNVDTVRIITFLNLPAVVSAIIPRDVVLLLLYHLG